MNFNLIKDFYLNRFQHLFFYHLVASLLPFFFCPSILFAQSELSRVSLTERSDRLGYVIRFHLTAPVDSFHFDQPDIDLIEITLFADGLSPTEIGNFQDIHVIASIDQKQLTNGLYVSIQLNRDRAFQASAYPDINRRDLLVGLVEIPVDDDTPGVVFTDNEIESTDLIETKRVASINTGRLFIGDPMEWYIRWITEDHQSLQLANHMKLSGSAETDLSSFQYFSHPWQNHPFFLKNEATQYKFFNPSYSLTLNTDYPQGGNDGPLWQGKGWNHNLAFGVGVNTDHFEAVFRPVFVSSRNRDFDLSPHPAYPGLSEYAMSLTYADLPQRFGDNPYSRLDMGDSFVRAFYKGWTTGISNERMRTGPAYVNPLLFGAHPPGFFHYFIGTDSPLKIPGGQLENRIFWGNLKDSEFFYGDGNEQLFHNSRYITGITLNFTPDLLPGLHLGFTRTAVSYVTNNGLHFSDLLMAFKRSQEKGSVIDAEDARFIKTVFTIRWYFPGSGFETYAEWGRNDNRRGIRDMLAEPELNRGYVLGFSKRIQTSSTGRIIMQGEITILENSSVSSQYRDFNIWYTHPLIQQGFTHRGQVLGASIGPGSSTQNLRFTYVDRFGLAGFSLGRIAMHNDRLFKNYDDYYFFTLPRRWMTQRWIQETEMYGIIHGLFFLPFGFELQLDLRYGLIENRHNQFIRTNEVDFEDIFFDEPNWNLSFILRYHL